MKASQFVRQCGLDEAIKITGNPLSFDLFYGKKYTLVDRVVTESPKVLPWLNCGSWWILMPWLRKDMAWMPVGRS